MVPTNPFLIGMQVAGMVVDTIGAMNQSDIIEAGRRVEQASFETNMEALLAQNAQSSLAEMRDLSANIGSQIANNAAKGTSSGGGTSASGNIEESSKAFSDDERVRKINLLSKQASLTAGNNASQLASISSQTKLAQTLSKRIFNTVGTAGGQKFFSGGSKSGFGLSKVGG